MPEQLTTAPTMPEHARGELRRLVSAGLMALLRTRVPLEASELPENAAPCDVYAGCECLDLRPDPDAAPSAAELACWAMVLDYLEAVAGLSGIERLRVDVLDDEGDPLDVAQVARLTAEGERQALAILVRWHVEAAGYAGAAVRDCAARCSRQLIRLPAEGGDRHESAILEHGRQLLTEVRPLAEALDDDAGSEGENRAASAEVWRDVATLATHRAAAILVHLEELRPEAPERLRGFALACLDLAHLLGARVGPGDPEEAAHHA